MSRPVIALFSKEWQQHGKTVIGFACLCALIHAMILALGLYYGNPISPELYLGIALYATLLYTWGIAGSVYAIELEKNTFPFLRNLPVSPLTIALGKIGFVLAAVASVLAINLLCAAVCWSVQGELLTDDIAEGILLILAPGIAEIFVWGILWSTRCRSAAFAVFAAALCAVLTLVIIFNVIPSGLNDIEEFAFVLPIRLTIVGIVGLLAGWSALRWFDFGNESRKRSVAERLDQFAEQSGRYVALRSRLSYIFRYPQTVQLPFFALIHQHLRHASLVYPLGVFCFALVSLGFLFLCFAEILKVDPFYFMPDRLGFIFILAVMSVSLCILIFWGNIFGHDQRNNSYRFLSRIGVHEGDVWWSRMVPATLLYLPVLPCFLLFLFSQYYTYTPAIEGFAFAAQFTFTAWLMLMALGAFCSISCEKQSTGIVGTFGLYWVMLYGSILFTASFGSSPLWTTVPLALAFLVASRLRAGYWLREITTWRSRLIPLTPVFAVMLAVLIALPFVRIYSVPYVSWEQIDTYLAGTPAPQREELLQNYEKHRAFARSVFSGEVLADMDSNDSLYIAYFCLRLMPWEEARRERILRLQIVASLVESGVVRDRRARAIGEFCERNQLGDPISNGGGLWDGVWENSVIPLSDSTR